MLSRAAVLSGNVTRRVAVSSRCLTGGGASVPVDVDHYANEGFGGDAKKSGKYNIQTFNKISQKGLDTFPVDSYNVDPADGASTPAHALLLRSHKLKEEEVGVSVRAIARCGAGTNNIPVARMTELGIPVFNTPGANANAVKELVLCGLLLGSRKIVAGINHMTDLGKQGLAKERVEKDKALFGGREIKGKTLAVIGLGHIGASTARDAAELGMDIVGYDPGLSVANALGLPRDMTLADSIASAVSKADYVSLNIPYIKGEGGTHGIIGKQALKHFKKDCVLLNFARGELVDSDDMKDYLDASNGVYISDFPDDLLWDHEQSIIIPHLGASTGEAEDSAAAMAAETIRLYMETGTIRHSVNFPDTALLGRSANTIRITVVNKNKPGVLALITEACAKANLNIVQQINQSKGDIAYTVLDIDPVIEDGSSSNLADFQKEVTLLEGVLNSRIIFGMPGGGYARNVEGTYVV